MTQNRGMRKPAICPGRGVFQSLKRRDKALFNLGKIGAEGKIRKKAGIRGRLQRALDSFRRIVARRLWQLERSLDLAGILGLPQQFVLKACVGDRQHRGDDFAVGFAADIGNAIFGDDNVAQMTRDGRMAVAPADIRLSLCPLTVRVACSMMAERASSRAKPWAMKLYWPPTPLTMRPSSSPSEITSPSNVAIMASLMKRAFVRARRLSSSSP